MGSEDIVGGEGGIQKLVDKFVQDCDFLAHASESDLLADVLKKPGEYWENLLYLSPQERSEYQIDMFQRFGVKITAQGVFYRDTCLYEGSLRQESKNMREENDALGLEPPWIE